MSATASSTHFNLLVLSCNVQKNSNLSGRSLDLFLEKNTCTMHKKQTPHEKKIHTGQQNKKINSASFNQKKNENNEKTQPLQTLPGSGVDVFSLCNCVFLGEILADEDDTRLSRLAGLGKLPEGMKNTP